MKNTICQCGRQKDRRSIQCRSCKDAEPLEKICNQCKVTFLIDEYSLRPNGRGGHKRRSRCKTCEATNAVNYRKDKPEQIKTAKQKYCKNNPDKVRRWGFRSQWRKRGFDPDEAEKFVAGREKKCEICGREPTKQALALDHCHETGRFRGLLCSECNMGIGVFKDSPALLQIAIQYLQKGQT